MYKFYLPLVVLAFYLSLAYSAPSFTGEVAAANTVNGDNHQNTLLSEIESDAAQNTGDDDDDNSNYDKRVERYAFGLGRRAYTYTNGGNGVKRLPVYNFGLGKRARPYSFGLGKRTEYDEDQQQQQLDFDFDRNGFNTAYMDEKRNRPYSFGLGKRDIDEVDRRGYPNRYGFGLGRR